MKEIKLKPLREKPEYYDEIEKEIIRRLKQEIYLPIIKILGATSNTLKNSKEDLVDALNSGKVVFSKGSFSGKFNSSISKELKLLGATWDRKTSSWKMPMSAIPMDIQVVIRGTQSRFQAVLASVNKQLTAVVPGAVLDKAKMSKIFDSTIFKVNKDFKESVKNIVVSPELTKEQTQKISTEWSDNMNKYIKDFTEKQIKDLRKKIMDNAMMGNRREEMVKEIQKSYGVSLNKAKFLAQQETSLFMSSFKQSRYEAAGSTEYIWTTVHMPKDNKNGEHIKGNVRYMHAQLNGTKQKWSSPPVTSPDGRRNHPGQDYRCRCYAIPVIKF